MAERALEDVAIIAYRRVANEIFQVAITNSVTKQVAAIVDANGDHTDLSGAMMLADLIDASLHILFHWAREWKSQEGTDGPTFKVGTFLAMIQDMTVHLCPALNGELGSESDL